MAIEPRTAGSFSKLAEFELHQCLHKIFDSTSTKLSIWAERLLISSWLGGVSCLSAVSCDSRVFNSMHLFFFFLEEILMAWF